MKADIIVIGGGPGGYVAAIRARQLGFSVTLIERDELGGTCLNRGCIPTKAYYQQAEVLSVLRELESYNISAGAGKLDMAAALARKNGIVKKLTGGVAGLLQGHGVTVVRGSARITAPGAVAVGEDTFTADRIIIATGSVNRPLPLPGIDLPCVLDSTGLLELDHIPPRLAIIGGGVIGVEFAGIFQSFGTQVTVIEAAPAILSGQDGEVVKRLQVYLKRQGIKVLTEAKVEAIRGAGDGAVLSVADRKGTQEVAADIVLLAAGRMPCTDGLGLEELGIEREGLFIKVNEQYETSLPGVYAIGDVIPGPMLAHLASDEGKCAVENMAGMVSRVNYDAVPGCIFSFPPVAAVGLTEEMAGERGIACRSGKFLFAANGKALCMGETDGFAKVLIDEQERVIGVHIIGPHAADLILEGTLMVRHQMTVTQIAETIHPHPTLGEVLQEAALDAVGQAIHLLPSKKNTIQK